MAGGARSGRPVRTRSVPLGRGPGAGRPTKLYKRSRRQLTVTLPERRYDVAGQLLAGAIDNAIDNAIADGTTVTDALTAAAAS